MRGSWKQAGCLRSWLLLALVGHLVAVSSHELLDSTGGVDQSFLASVERVAESADFAVHDVVLDPVDGLGVSRLGGGDTGPLVLTVNENDGICVGMDALLHF